MINNILHPKGELDILLTDENGFVKLHKIVPNLVVSSGREYIAQRMLESDRPAEMSYMAIGDSDATALVSDTTLANELARVAFDSASASSNTVTFEATWGPGVGTGVISEAGIFNDSAAGTMLARTTFADVNKLAGDTLAIDWTITIS